jgi:membrane fusion protein, macrolide-specific efflux system
MTERLLPTLLLICLLSGCFILPKEEDLLAPPLLESPQITYEVFEARRGEIINDLEVNGTFVYARRESIFFRFGGGRLLKIYVSEADQVKSGQLIAELDTESLKYQIAMQELTLQKARLQAEHASLLGKDRIEQQLAAIDVRQAELTLDKYRTELSRAQLFSPFDGVVVYQAGFAEGDLVDAYRTVVSVADPRVIELSYQGVQNSDFAFGQEAEVIFRDKILPGKVVQTPAMAPIDAPEPERSQVIVRVKNLPSSIKVGDSATIRVVLQKRDNAIIIPRNLVQSYLGEDFVNILVDGIKRQQSVKQGIVSATEVEIVKGLKEGDKVIVW